MRENSDIMSCPYGLSRIENAGGQMAGIPEIQKKGGVKIPPIMIRNIYLF